VKYRSGRFECLTWARDPGQGQCLAGSLTGALASQKVTEAPKGTLSPVGNRVLSASAQGCLTVRQTCRAGEKAGLRSPSFRAWPVFRAFSSLPGAPCPASDGFDRGGRQDAFSRGGERRAAGGRLRPLTAARRLPRLGWRKILRAARRGDWGPRR